ncbi:MAG: molybdenum ABC transporter permease, partial [Methanobacteriota archaeon]
MNTERKTTSSPRSDPFLLACSLMGGTLVALVLLALAALVVPELADLAHLGQVAGESEVVSAILITFGGGLAAVFILMVLGTPLAYVLARTQFRGKPLVESLLVLPLVLPHTVAGLMVYLLFMQRGPIGAPLSAAG